MQVYTVKIISLGRNHMEWPRCLRALAVIALADVDNAIVRTSGNGDIRRIKDESIAKMEGAAKLRELFRYISGARNRRKPWI